MGMRELILFLGWGGSVICSLPLRKKRFFQEKSTHVNNSAQEEDENNNVKEVVRFGGEIIVCSIYGGEWSNGDPCNLPLFSKSLSVPQR